MVRLGDVRPRLWQEIVEDLAQGGIEIPNEHFDWRDTQENSNQCDDIEVPDFASPESRYYSNFMEIASNAGQLSLALFDASWRWLLPNSDIFQREPMLPWAVLIILYFFLRKHIRFSNLVLLYVFLLNITPLYAFLLFACAFFYSQPYAPKGYTKSKRISSTDVSIPFEDVVYDYILLGESISTYFCASILAVVGKRVLVLVPKHSPKYAVLLCAVSFCFLILLLDTLVEGSCSVRYC